MNASELIIVQQAQSGYWKNTKGFPQSRYDYDAGNLLIYSGIAPQGAATSDAKWLIQKYTYDGANNLTSIKTSKENVVWDNRATSVTYS